MRINQYKQGIALVVVLGFLAILTILAVGFSISMRVERIVSATELDYVKARMLAESALANAMDAVDADVVDGVWPKLFDDDHYLVSVPSSVSSSNAHFISDAMMKYVPADLTNGLLSLLDSIEWINVTNGRMAYVVLNCSGYADVNYLNDQRATAGPICMMSSSGFDPDAAHFVDELTNTHYYYSSLYDLTENATSVADDIDGAFTFSYAPRQYLVGTNWFTNYPYYMGTNTSSISTNMQVITNMLHSYVSTIVTNTDIFAANLLNYLDPDHSVSNFEYEVEAVPLINEVLVENEFAVDGGYGSNVLSISVELFYPFASSYSSSNITVTISNQVGASGQPLGMTNNWFASTNVSMTTNAYRSLRYSNQFASVSFLTNDSAGYFGRTHIFDISLSEGMQQIDKVSITITGLTSTAVAGDVSTTSAEINDPRFNGYASRWRVFTNDDTFGSTNTIYTGSNTIFYVRNQDAIDSVAELAFVTYNTEDWSRSELLSATNTGMQQVLTQLSVIDATNALRGCVNPNSTSIDGLASLFYNAPSSLYPGLGTNRISESDAIAFAKSVTNVAGSFTNRGEISQISPTPSNFNDVLKRELAIRSCLELLAPRQQIYTVLFIGESGKWSDSDIFYPAGQQRGIATIWRDGYPDSNGMHRSFIQFFKWLD